MIATTHLAVGAAISLWSSRLIGNLFKLRPGLLRTTVQTGTAFTVATTSHLVLDLIPHNDGIYHTIHGVAPVLSIELTVIFSVIFWIVRLRNLGCCVLVAGLVGAAWLDMFSILGWVFPAHKYFHSLYKPELAGSLALQLVISIIALTFLF